MANAQKIARPKVEAGWLATFKDLLAQAQQPAFNLRKAIVNAKIPATPATTVDPHILPFRKTAQGESNVAQFDVLRRGLVLGSEEFAAIDKDAAKIFDKDEETGRSKAGFTGSATNIANRIMAERVAGYAPKDARQRALDAIKRKAVSEIAKGKGSAAVAMLKTLKKDLGLSEKDASAYEAELTALSKKWF